MLIVYRLGKVHGVLVSEPGSTVHEQGCLQSGWRCRGGAISKPGTMMTEVADTEGQAGTSGTYTKEAEGTEQFRSRGACRSIFTACMALVEAFIYPALERRIAHIHHLHICGYTVRLSPCCVNCALSSGFQ
jgi:hypothetical protein